ncbi:MAG: hypothetical protein HY738_08600, partial [Bacteroidia bacterium]|nr:hypothetical protein [Bacteroidia bacterium]
HYPFQTLDFACNVCIPIDTLYAIAGAITLADDSSLLEIAGNLLLAPGTTFTYTGNGYMKFSNPAYPSVNIIAGGNSSVLFNGTGKDDKVLEITQETMYIPEQVNSFSLTNCKTVMGNSSRLQCNGLNTVININNAKITSVNGQYNSHRGLTLFGQPDITIQNSFFEYGYYGIYSFMTTGGNPLTIVRF